MCGSDQSIMQFYFKLYQTHRDELYAKNDEDHYPDTMMPQCFYNAIFNS